MTRSNRQKQYRLRRTVAGVALMGIISSLALYFVFRGSEKERFEHELRNLATSRLAALDYEVQRYTDFLQGYLLLFSLRQELSYAEFIESTQLARRQYPGISAIEWAPLLSPPEFTALRANSQQLGLPPLVLKSLIEPGKLIEVENPTEPVQPVLYISPFEQNQDAYGFDILSGINRPEIEHARAIRQPTMSRVAPLVRRQPVPGFVLYLPVYQGHEADENYRGSLIGVFELEQFLIETASVVGEGNADILLEDVTPRGAEGPLALLKADGTIVSGPDLTGRDPAGSFARSFTYSPWQRKWKLTLSPTPEWIVQNSSHAPILLLLLGLSLTAGICLVLVQKDRYLSEIEERVKQRTLELESSRSELQAVLDHSPNPIFLKSTDGRYIVANERVTKINESPRKKYIGFTDEELFPPERAKKYRESDARVIASHAPHSYEEVRETEEGKRRLLISKFPIQGPSGQLIAIGGISFDITDRSNREAQDRSTERRLLESLRLHSLNTMAGGIAHDFNNLLAIVLANTNVLAEHFRDQASAADLKSLQDIEEAVERASVLCRRMLAFSGLIQLQPKVIDASAFISENLGILRLSMGRHRQPRLELADNLPAILSDETQLLEVLNCLINNAADAISDHDGMVLIKTRLVDATADMLARAVQQPILAPGPFVEISVTDNGSGIDPADLDHIFDPFFTTKSIGRGLGLSAVMGIVKRSKGALLVESEVGGGSTFRALWPLAPQVVITEETPPPDPLIHDADTELHALVVDDENSVRYILAKAITNMGIHVTEAVDGEQGLALMHSAERPFDFVVTDLTMPNLDGDEMLAKLREKYPRLPALIISGYSLNDAKERFGGQSHTLFLPKPFRLNKLRETIEAIKEVVRQKR